MFILSYNHILTHQEICLTLTPIIYIYLKTSSCKSGMGEVSCCGLFHFPSKNSTSYNSQSGLINFILFFENSENSNNQSIIYSIQLIHRLLIGIYTPATKIDQSDLLIPSSNPIQIKTIYLIKASKRRLFKAYWW